MHVAGAKRVGEPWVRNQDARVGNKEARVRNLGSARREQGSACRELGKRASGTRKLCRELGKRASGTRKRASGTRKRCWELRKRASGQGSACRELGASCATWQQHRPTVFYRPRPARSHPTCLSANPTLPALPDPTLLSPTLPPHPVQGPAPASTSPYPSPPYPTEVEVLFGWGRVG